MLDWKRSSQDVIFGWQAGTLKAGVAPKMVLQFKPQDAESFGPRTQASDVLDREALAVLTGNMRNPFDLCK